MKMMGAHSGRAKTAVLTDLAQSSNSDELWGDLGDAFAADGQLQQARTAYERAHQLDSSDSEWNRKLAELPRGTGGEGY